MGRSRQAPGRTDMAPRVDSRGARLDRSHRARDVRSSTISMLRVPRRERLAVASEPYPDDVVRPVTRGDCADGERPCPFVSCRHHLYLDELVGSLKLNFPDIEPDELAETCSLDVADRGGASLEVVGDLLNVTRERTRQIEEKALRLVAIRARAAGLEVGR